MRILALVPGGIGDQILFFPTLDSLKQAYPAAEIDVVVEPQSKGAYRVCTAVQTAIAFKFQDRNSLADWSNLLGVIRDREYEAVLAVDSQWGLGLLLWLSGIPSRVGYGGNAGSMFLTNAVPLKPAQYRAHQYYDLLQGLGITAPCPELSVNVPKADIEWAEAEQQRLGVQESGYVLLHNGSSQLDGAYPVKHWQAIVADFQEKQPQLPIVLLDDSADPAWASTLSKTCPGVKLMKPGDVGKLTASIAAATLMVCPDSAPMQLAVALQVPTVALFGSTDPKKQLPQTDRVMVIASPTGKLADIYPQMVLEQVWKG